MKHKIDLGIRQFASMTNSQRYKASIKGGKTVQQERKKLGIGAFPMSKKRRLEVTTKAGRIAARINKINKSGFWNSEQQSKFGKLGGKIAAKNNKKNNTGPFFNPAWNRRQRSSISKNKKSYFFKGIYYDSKGERELAANIYYQFEKLVLWKNYQFIVNSKIIDFFIKRYKCFIEYHPYDRSGLTYEQYYDNRREILNNNGYKDYNLLVIK